MKPTKTCTVLIALAAVAAPFTVARGGGGALYTPYRQGYDYHRRHRQSAIDLVSDMFSIPFYNTNTLFRQQHNQLSRWQQSSEPRYSISEDEKVVELSMEVPGVPASDLSVEIENGSLLHIRGSRTVRESGVISKTDFNQSFQVEDIDFEKIAVSLSNGILTVTAPKKEPVVKRVPLEIEENHDTPKVVEVEGVREEEEMRAEEEGGEAELTITEDEI